MAYKNINNLKVDEELLSLINDEILPTTNINKNEFWSGFENIIEIFTPINRELLSIRDELQSKIDTWYLENEFNEDTFSSYKSFLKEIDYLVKSPDDFEIQTSNVDEEITKQCAPQLVVPLKNARFALNAANARWGSLYDALYGSDVIPNSDELAITKQYNKKRGEEVVKYAKNHLDTAIPLKQGSHNDAVSYKIVENSLQITLKDETITTLEDSSKFIGFNKDIDNPSELVFKNNNLHIIVQLDKDSFIGSLDSANINDIIVESAVTTIMDCEDSIAAVDASDKVEVYKNWFGLMKGDLQSSFKKGDKVVTRVLNDDKVFKALDGSELVLHGRSLLFIRNVGHLMTNSAILDKNGDEVFEGIMDCMLTTLSAIVDIKKQNKKINSKKGNVYIVKPKMHGPKEVAFAVELFTEVEKVLKLEENCIKIGIMDEERRTSVNLKACIKEAKNRVVFINTGFLDRTGDEIHTSMKAGAMVAKTVMKNEAWISAYEKNNVQIGLQCGLQGKAQIGKGMWAMPDEMAKMMSEKIGHLKAGATTAWVPSPTAAVLHSMHYHQLNVFDVQDELKNDKEKYLDKLLTIPLLKEQLSKEVIQNEINNNAQGILGYVVRWIDMGIGCSKVPDINNIALMEDRATLRISSQALANWIEHKICTKDEVLKALKDMAKVVDEQNKNDKAYKNMSPSYDDLAFEVACKLVFQGVEQPSGYTEPLLHKYRVLYKAKYKE